MNSAGGQLDGDHALTAAVIHQKFGDKPFVISYDGVIFEAGLEESVEHMKTGLVGRKPGALDLHAAKRPHRNRAIFLPAPGTPPVFELKHFLRGFIDKYLDGILIAHPIRAGDSVVGMIVKAVVGLDNCRRPTFGRHGVAAHWINFRDHRDAQFRVDFSNGNCSAQTGSTATHY